MQFLCILMDNRYKFLFLITVLKVNICVASTVAIVRIQYVIFFSIEIVSPGKLTTIKHTAITEYDNIA